MGILGKSESAVADQIHGRFVTGDVQQHDGGDELRKRQSLPGFLHGNKRAEHIVAEVLASVLNDRYQEPDDVLDGLARLHQLRRSGRRFEGQSDCLAPVA